jgi:hypothetical protein
MIVTRPSSSGRLCAHHTSSPEASSQDGPPPAAAACAAVIGEVHVPQGEIVGMTADPIGGAAGADRANRRMALAPAPQA